jgi:hypothetical protein
VSGKQSWKKYGDAFVNAIIEFQKNKTEKPKEGHSQRDIASPSGLTCGSLH